VRLGSADGPQVDWIFLAAPSATGPALRFPGMRDHEAMPRLDEHLVPEGSREEVLRGRRIIAAPARNRTPIPTAGSTI
jgi:hypothetical protein